MRPWTALNHRAAILHKNAYPGNSIVQRVLAKVKRIKREIDVPLVHMERCSTGKTVKCRDIRRRAISANAKKSSVDDGSGLCCYE
jgi:hypothetical protein